MVWYHYVSYFFGGVFLANTLPHLINGISGRKFQSPFASPPGEGLSSSTVNVVWGLLNLAVAWLLVCRVGSFSLQNIVRMDARTPVVIIQSALVQFAWPVENREHAIIPD